MPLLGGLLLVGCGDAAANETCGQLQEFEVRIIAADAEEENVSDILATTYTDISALAAQADGDLGVALLELQPLLEQLGALTGTDETAAIAAQEALAELSEEEIQAIDDAANYVNETCELSVLL